MRLNSDNTIVTSSDSNLRLSVFSSNYYLRDTDVAVFTVNGTAYPCSITQRVYINVDFDVTLPEGTYQYDLAITRDGDKTITLLSGDFIVKDGAKYRSALLDTNTLKGIAIYAKILGDSELAPFGLQDNSERSASRFVNSEQLVHYSTSELIRQLEYPASAGGLRSSAIAERRDHDRAVPCRPARPRHVRRRKPPYAPFECGFHEIQGGALAACLPAARRQPRCFLPFRRVPAF